MSRRTQKDHKIPFDLSKDQVDLAPVYAALQGPLSLFEGYEASIKCLVPIADWLEAYLQRNPWVNQKSREDAGQYIEEVRTRHAAIQERRHGLQRWFRLNQDSSGALIESIKNVLEVLSGIETQKAEELSSDSGSEPIPKADLPSNTPISPSIENQRKSANKKYKTLFKALFGFGKAGVPNKPDGHTDKDDLVIPNDYRDVDIPLENGDVVVQWDPRSEAGVGGFGHITRGFTRTGVAVAVKEPLYGRGDASVIEAFKNEAAKLRALSEHPRIVKFLGYNEYKGCPQLIFEYAENGDVVKYVIQKQQPADRLDIVRGLASAVAFMHSKGWIHGDIKTDNVLVNRNKGCLLADLGLAKRTGYETSNASKGNGNVRYMAPELCTTDGRIDTSVAATRTEATDVYSFGIVVYEILEATPAWKDLDGSDPNFHKQLYDAKMVGLGPSPRPTLNNSEYRPAWTFAEKCWDPVRETRPKMAEAGMYIGDPSN